MAYSPKAISNDFLNLAWAQGKNLTPMKIQKLVYFAHGWHLATAGKILIAEPIEAWRFGPVIRSLYAELAEFGNTPVNRMLDDRVFGDADHIYEYTPYIPSINRASAEGDFAYKLVSRIWDKYGPLTAIQLSKMTHQPGTPWDAIAKEYGEEFIPDRKIIPNDAIRDYFRGQLSVTAH